MNGLVQQQQTIYEQVWDVPEYRQKCHSLDLWHYHRDIFPEHFATALDIGCGRGLLMKLLNDLGIDTWGVDHVSNCLDPDVSERWGHKFVQASLWELDLGRVFQLGICTDVMEHIPEEMVPVVLERIAVHCMVVIFKIANFPSQVLGHDLHLTRRSADWWLEIIKHAGGYVLPLDIISSREDYYFTWYL